MSLISIVVARDISQWMEEKIDAESDDKVGVAYQIYENSHMFPMPDQNGLVQGPDFKLKVTPGEMERRGMNVNFFQPMDSMPMGFPGMSMGFPGMPMGMGMGMPNMNMNMNMYPGYQGMTRTNACGCSSSCGMPCMPWFPCPPCIQCPPCQTTTLPPDNNPPIITTTLAPTTTTTVATTTTIQTATQELTTQ